MACIHTPFFSHSYKFQKTRWRRRGWVGKNTVLLEEDSKSIESNLDDRVWRPICIDSSFDRWKKRGKEASQIVFTEATDKEGNEMRKDGLPSSPEARGIKKQFWLKRMAMIIKDKFFFKQKKSWSYCISQYDFPLIVFPLGRRSPLFVALRSHYATAKTPREKPRQTRC